MQICEEGESDAGHVCEARGGKVGRKAPMQREGELLHERGRDKSKIPRGPRAGEMQIDGKKHYHREESELYGMTA